MGLQLRDVAVRRTPDRHDRVLPRGTEKAAQAKSVGYLTADYTLLLQLLQSRSLCWVRQGCWQFFRSVEISVLSLVRTEVHLSRAAICGCTDILGSVQRNFLKHTYIKGRRLVSFVDGEDYRVHHPFRICPSGTSRGCYFFSRRHGY